MGKKIYMIQWHAVYNRFTLDLNTQINKNMKGWKKIFNRNSNQNTRVILILNKRFYKKNCNKSQKSYITKKSLGRYNNYKHMHQYSPKLSEENIDKIKEIESSRNSSTSISHFQ